MREFFKGWRRKVGCSFLIMAVGVSVMWARSLAIQDFLCFELGNSHCDIRSLHGAVQWHRTIPIGMRIGLLWGSTNFEDFGISPEIDNDPHWSMGTVEWRYRWNGFVWGGVRFPNWNARTEIWVVPFWAITLTMTLLSALLILWKPRSKPKDTPDA